MGFMIVSSFLSMWISNTATTAMMLPIAHAVLQQLKATEAQADERDFQATAEDNHAFELEIRPNKEETMDEKKPQIEEILDEKKPQTEESVDEKNPQAEETTCK